MDKETLYSIQKRPIKVLKETYHSVKRDFLQHSTRPTYNTPKETYDMPKETYHMPKETYFMDKETFYSIQLDPQ